MPTSIDSSLVNGKVSGYNVFNCKLIIVPMLMFTTFKASSLKWEIGFSLNKFFNLAMKDSMQLEQEYTSVKLAS
jgi:hypothetical protein